MVLQASAATTASGKPSLLQREGPGAILLATWQEHRTAQALAQAQAAAAHSRAAQMEAEVSSAEQAAAAGAPAGSLAHTAGLCTQLERHLLQLCSMLCAACRRPLLTASFSCMVVELRAGSVLAVGWRCLPLCLQARRRSAARRAAAQEQLDWQRARQQSAWAKYDMIKVVLTEAASATKVSSRQAQLRS